MHRSFSVIFDYLQLSSVFFGKCSEFFWNIFRKRLSQMSICIANVIDEKENYMVAWRNKIDLQVLKNISRVSTENEWNSFHSFFTVRQCNNPYTVYFILWESVSWWTWLIIIHLGTAVTYFIMQTPNIAFWINYSTLYTATISQL